MGVERVEKSILTKYVYLYMQHSIGIQLCGLFSYSLMKFAVAFNYDGF